MGMRALDGPRLFTQAEVDEVVSGLRAPAGWFVPTLLHLELGQLITLSVHVFGVAGRVELPARVISRRLPGGASRRLMAGVAVKLVDHDHPRLLWLASQRPRVGSAFTSAAR